MRLRRCEAGFTLVEMIVVTAIIVIVAGALGTFFLAGATPAVAAAGRDVTAAFDEARRTAIAFDAATVVFAPARSGSGYSARIYARAPGDPGFAPRNGPTYDSTVTISETASPLGAPGFAFAVDAHGSVTGYANFVDGQQAFTMRACPASGAFALHLTYERDARNVTIPCQLGLSSATPVGFATPAPAYSASPFPIQTCPATVSCSLALVVPAATPATPAAGSSSPSVPAPDPSAVLPVSPPTPAPPATPAAGPSSPSVPAPDPSAVLPVSPPTPAPEPTACPAGFSGSAPACSGLIIEQYSATADFYSPHTSTLFADGSICDDNGCSIFGPIVWSWACPFAAQSGSQGRDGSNFPYQPDNGFDVSVESMIGIAEHNAAEGNGDGNVLTGDSYCVGFPAPNP
jgi:prepilin-type N-terminal cleavage/methylation domain-containing protein